MLIFPSKKPLSFTTHTYTCASLLLLPCFNITIQSAFSMRLIAAIKCRNYAPLHAGDINQCVCTPPLFFTLFDLLM